MKPIWLLTTIWTVPPVRNPFVCDNWERLGDYALSGKRSVAMHEHWQYLGALDIFAALLTGPHGTLHDRVHDLEV